MNIDTYYAYNELRKALRLKSECEDADSITRAEKLIAQWKSVVERIENGALETDSYPVWVTLEIVRGGFATGRAIADVPFSDEERERLAVLAPNARVSRESLFAALLSDGGRAWLRETLASRKYKIEYPEDAALFVIAWLFENGKSDEAMSIVEEITPYAPTLRFLPKSADQEVRASELVHRFSSNEVRTKLSDKYGISNINIETQREALAVWIPYMDRLVAHWLVLFDGNADEPPRVLPDLPFGWLDGAKALADQYKTLKERCSLCKKYHNPKENLQILLSATRDFLKNGSSATNLGRAGHVVRRYVKAHGAPGGARHAKTRVEQSLTASAPGYKLIAFALIRRLPQTDEGIENIDEFLDTIPAEEMSDTAARYAASEIPESMLKIVRNATAAPLPELIRQGIVTSPDMLKSFVAQVKKSMEVFRSYDDENIALLMAETYKAFSRRPIPRHTQPPKGEYDELPWVKPLKRERRGVYGVTAALRVDAALRADAALRVAGYSLDFFPGVILPGTFVSLLNELYRMSGRERPFISEPAADIFMGRFTFDSEESKTFAKAALTAANLLCGSLYEKYYGLDYGVFKKHAADLRLGQNNKEKSGYEAGLVKIFERTVRESAPPDPALAWNDGVSNGMLIELAQIYATDNLATIVAEGVQLEHSYGELAFMACEYSLRLIKKALRPNVRNVLRLTKNAAYAWRQSLFFISLAPREAVDTFLSGSENLSASLLGTEITAQLFTGLRIAANGGSPEKEGYRPFKGWISGFRRSAHFRATP
ncbi:MAG: hypothetical protein LBK91_06555 [Synergistaceae bacterium]|nr:hypothetical protein [Synergistaceae bacterium]